MPIDLSNVGLQGQQAYATKMMTLAQGRQMESTAQQQELENQETEKMNYLQDLASQEIRKAARGDPDPNSPFDPNEVDNASSMADSLEITARTFANYGAPTKAAELFAKASTIRKQEQEIESAAITDKTHQLDNQIKIADVTARHLGMAQNQSEYDYGINELRRQGLMDPALIDKLASVPWSPDLSAYIGQQSMSYKDNAAQELQRQQQESMDLARTRSAANADRRTAIAERAQKSLEDHRKAVEKASGSKAGSSNTPNAQERAIGANAISAAFFNGKDAKTAKVVAMGDDIAARAKMKIKENPAISFDTAIQQAITDARMDGTIGEATIEGGLLSSPAHAVSYTPGGKTKETALPLTRGKKVIPGRFYITPKGIGQADKDGLIDIPD